MTADERREAAETRKAKTEKSTPSERAPRGARRKPMRDAAQNIPAEKRTR